MQTSNDESKRRLLPLRSGSNPVLSADTGRTVRPDSSVNSSIASLLFIDPEFRVVDSASFAKAVAWLCISEHPEITGIGVWEKMI